MQFTEVADAEFIDATAIIFEIWGSTHYNERARTLVVLPSDEKCERELKNQLNALILDHAPLSWSASVAER